MYPHQHAPSWTDSDTGKLVDGKEGASVDTVRDKNEEDYPTLDEYFSQMRLEMDLMDTEIDGHQMDITRLSNVTEVSLLNYYEGGQSEIQDGRLDDEQEMYEEVDGCRDYGNLPPFDLSSSPYFDQQRRSSSITTLPYRHSPSGTTPALFSLSSKTRNLCNQSARTTRPSSTFAAQQTIEYPTMQEFELYITSSPIIAPFATPVSIPMSRSPSEDSQNRTWTRMELPTGAGRSIPGAEGKSEYQSPSRELAPWLGTRSYGWI